MSNNNVILFLGSGFSVDTINKLGENFPSGRTLSEKIWIFLGYKTPYDGTSLPEMYQAFINSGIKLGKLNQFLEDNLTASSVPEVYNNIAKPYWYKVYTLNIDNVLDIVYRRAGKQLQTLKFPKDDFEERDQSLERLQVVHLNGKLPSNPSDIIFSNTQYARATLTHQPLYAQFVYDYAVKAVIFLGTEINEPLFESYLEAREGKRGKELRPRSYIIKPSLSVVKADNYKTRYNVHHIQGTTNDFLKWLESISNRLLPKEEILKSTFPNLTRILAGDGGIKDSNDLRMFAEAFNKVPTDHSIRNERSAFLLGATPSWNDIFRELDIPRTITNTIHDQIISIFKENKSKISLLSILGTAGSGKSTILKRLALRLTQEGEAVYICYSDYMPRHENILNTLRSINKRTIIMFDNAENIIYALPRLIATINKLLFPPLIVLAARTSCGNKLNSIIDSEIDYFPTTLPDLDDTEIVDLINKLEANNLLGILKGYTERQRFDTFKLKAKKQILIALKEATSGQLFEEIIHDEFEKIDPIEAQILCICIALNTEQGFTNSKQDFVGFSKVPPSDALEYLANTLSGTIVYGGQANNEKLMIRHRIVAEYFIKHCTTLSMLKEAYVRVLSILAPELKNNHTSSRKFNLYRSLINHQILYERFEKNIEEARAVYDSISSFFSDDFQFWLQYGCLELEGRKGDMTLAENYINQAESINYNNTYVLNAKCTLHYKKSLTQSSQTKAQENKLIGDEIAEYLIAESGKENSYTYHIYCRGRYEYMKQWIESTDDKKEELQSLITIISDGIKNHPFDKRLQRVGEELNRAYLHLAVSDIPINITVFETNI